MNCPSDGTQLAMSERNGIEIDYCPTCRGVWLDRGEIDKIIERADTGRNDAGAPDDGDRKVDEPSKKKRNLLGDLFDFGG